jgi:hypothetical protein
MQATEKTVPTSLKLPASVKRGIDEAARAAGTSPHAYMVGVLQKEAERARLREQFHRDAREALDEMQATGLGYDWDEVKDYLRARALDPQAPRPPLRPWR